MFASNVAPKRRIRETRDWYCHRCDTEVARYLSKCPQCDSKRSN